MAVVRVVEVGGDFRRESFILPPRGIFLATKVASQEQDRCWHSKYHCCSVDKNDAIHHPPRRYIKSLPLSP